MTTASLVLALVLALPGMLVSEAEFLRSVGTEQGILLLQIEGIAGWGDGSFVVSDKLAGTIALLDEAGKLVAEADTRVATGAAGGPASLDCHGRWIAVADFASRRIQIFSRDLLLSGAFQSEGPVINLRFAPDGTLWLAAQTARGKELLHYDVGGRLLGRLLPRELTGEAFSDVFLCAVDHQGTLALAYCVRNVIEIWDSSRNFCQLLSVQELPPEPPGRTIRRGLFRPDLHLPDGPLIRSVATDRNGNLLILGGDYGSHPGRDLYVLNPDGEASRALVLAHRASHIWVSEAGLLLAVDQTKSRVDFYRLHYAGQRP